MTDWSPRAREVASDVALTDVLGGHPTGLVVGDAHGRVRYRNQAASRLDGTHSGVLLEAAIERHLAAGRAGGRSDEIIEFYGPPKMVFDVTALPLDDGGSVVFVDDISERRRIDQVRTDFVANISHELKTPIGAMSVLAETLVDEQDPATVLRIVNRMLAEADRATRTIEDLMELSRIEAGGEVVVEDVRVSDVIRGAFDRVTELASRRNISISTLEPVDGDAQRSDRLVVRGDRRQLVSAVGNLVENAVKYSDAGTSVQVRAKRNDGVGRDRRHRSGCRHSEARSRPNLRTLLPGRSGPQSNHRRDGSRPVDRAPRRFEPSRRGRRHVHRGGRQHLRVAAPYSRGERCGSATCPNR